MKKRFVLLGLPAFMVLLIATSCKPNFNTSPPGALQACAILGPHTYICGGLDSPGNLIINGNGAMQIAVVSNGTSGVQFSQIVTYRPNNWLSPNVAVQNGTSSTGTQKIKGATSTGASTEVLFDVPNGDGYTISCFYTEYGVSAPSNSATGNTSTCSNPPANSEKCYRYFKMLALDPGAVPRCQSFNNVPPITIVLNQFEEPNVMFGDCI